MAANQIHNAAVPEKHDDRIDHTCHRKIFYADFGLFYQLPRNSGPLFPVTNVIDTYVYRSLKENGNIGMAAAANLYQSLIGFVLVLSSNFAVRKIDKDSALF